MSWEDVIKLEGHGRKIIEAQVKYYDRRIVILEKEITKMKQLKKEFEKLLEDKENQQVTFDIPYGQAQDFENGGGG